jgi:hypothetical protein
VPRCCCCNCKGESMIASQSSLWPARQFQRRGSTGSTVVRHERLRAAVAVAGSRVPVLYCAVLRVYLVECTVHRRCGRGCQVGARFHVRWEWSGGKLITALGSAHNKDRTQQHTCTGTEEHRSRRAQKQRYTGTCTATDMHGNKHTQQ